MRASLPALLLLPVALTGCPALLSDWTIGGVAEDASVDAGGHDAAGDSSTGPSGSFDASLDADASQASEDAAATDSRREASESGSSDASQDDSLTQGDSGPTDAGLCDGGPIYVHHVGLDGLTWQDCVPTGTYNAAQALAACAAYAVANGAAVAGCSVNAEPMLQNICGSTVTVSLDGTEAAWLYQLYTGQQGAVGHVVTGGGCPGAQDSTWD